jgi:hypothetical protein
MGHSHLGSKTCLNLHKLQITLGNAFASSSGDDFISHNFELNVYRVSCEGTKLINISTCDSSSERCSTSL